MQDDPHRLSRFVDAQDPVYEIVLAELRAGRKRTHWMWFVFPQVAGLGSSWMAQEYAIHSREEAKAYLAHPVLGERLRECTEIMLAHKGRGLRKILGYPDDLKFRSSMTLFAEVSDSTSIYETAIQRLFNGERDSLTLSLL